MAKQRVLIVEDEAVLALNLKLNLIDLGYQVVAIRDTAQGALEAALTCSPDIVLMDIKLKGETDGITAAAQIQSQIKVPVIFLTGVTDLAVLERAKRASPFGYLIKPFEIHSLRASIEIALYRHKTDHLMKEKDNQIRRVMDSLSDLVCQVDRQGRLEYASPSHYIVMGYRARALAGRPIYDLIHPDDQLFVRKVFEETFRCCATERIEFRYRRQDGEYFWVECTISPLAGSELQATGATLGMHDITERRKMEEELVAARRAAEAANQAKSDFLARMSHELRTPLNAILGFANLISSDPNLPSEHHESVEIIARSGEHLLSIINDLLDLAKLEAGIMPLHIRCFDLPRLFQGVGDMFGLSAQDKGLELVFEGVDDLPARIFGDEGKLHQVLVNLLGNAIKFTSEGVITVRTTCQPDPAAGLHALRLQVEVEDNGPGIDPEEMSNLFSLFIQASAGLDAEQGSGLGLVICKEFVQRMGGAIQARSDPGPGSAFTFDVLLYTQEQDAAQP